VLKTEKERIVAELTDRLAATDTLIVADYRGLTNKELEALRARLTEHGARLSIVKNTLTRRAAEAAGADTLLALLEGPTAIAFVEADGDPAGVAKALADTARDTKVLAIRGGVLDGAPLSGDQVDELAKLPPVDILRGQFLAVVVAPLTQLAALLAAPLRDLVGLIDARIEQLGGAEPEPEAKPVDKQVDKQVDKPEGEPKAEAEPEPEPEGEADAETQTESAAEPAEEPLAEAETDDKEEE
jgi:large subunit ribosomal protein L10